MKKLKPLIKKIWNFKKVKQVDKVIPKVLSDDGTMGSHVDDFIKLKNKMMSEEILKISKLLKTRKSKEKK